MIKKIKEWFISLKQVFSDCRGEGDTETVKQILFTPAGYKFMQRAAEKYAVELGMLNQLLRQNLISVQEHTAIKSIIRRKYNIKNDFS